MPLIAIISRPDLCLLEWQLVVDQQEELTAEPPRQIQNPFTGKPETFTPLPTSVSVRIDGGCRGAIVPSAWFEDDHELLLFAEPGEEPHVEACARRMAEVLHATIEWVGPDHPQRARAQ